MKGIYIILIKVKKDISVKIGKLNNLKFKIGYYTYIGSAQNNLEKRIKRHMKKRKKLHWHIDYLLKNKNIKIIGAYYKIAKKNEECKTARRLIKNNLYINKFGCSDCNCKSHLIKINIKSFNESVSSHFQRF